jgi:flagellar hook assembly protein FlgD
MAPNVGLNEEVSFEGIRLAQNFPNPANGTTTISYELAQAGNVTLEVYDVTGKKVMEVNAGQTAAGQHNFVLDANSLNAGLYNYSLVVNDTRVTKTMMVK